MGRREDRRHFVAVARRSRGRLTFFSASPKRRPYVARRCSVRTVERPGGNRCLDVHRVGECGGCDDNGGAESGADKLGKDMTAREDEEVR
jgi:hypothetical protein